MTTLRRAGYLERWHITRAALHLDPCVVCAARYYFDKSVPAPDHALFLKALTNVVRRHAALRTYIPDVHSSNPVYAAIPVEEIDLHKVVTFVDTASPSMEQVAKEQAALVLDSKSRAPLWRVVVYSDWNIVFAWHHAIADGLSSVAFHTTLLDALQDLAANPESVAPLSEVFYKAIDQTIDASPSFPLLAKALLVDILPNSWTMRGCWTGHPVIAKPSGTNVEARFMDFKPEVTQKLLALCREHKATMTGMIHELVTSVLSRILAENQPRKWNRIPFSIAVSFRDQTKVPSQAFCDHVSAYHSKQKVQPTFSWSGAKVMSETLKNDLSSGLQLVGALRYIFGRYEAFFQGKLGKKREKGFEISNLGKVLPSERTGPWGVDDFAWLQYDVIVGAAIAVGVVTSPSGKLSISVRWGEGMKDPLAETFVQRLERDLLALVSETNGHVA